MRSQRTQYCDTVSLEKGTKSDNLRKCGKLTGHVLFITRTELHTAVLHGICHDSTFREQCARQPAHHIKQFSHQLIQLALALPFVRLQLLA